jgi:hypothetical protein
MEERSEIKKKRLEEYRSSITWLAGRLNERVSLQIFLWHKVVVRRLIAIT